MGDRDLIVTKWVTFAVFYSPSILLRGFRPLALWSVFWNIVSEFISTLLSSIADLKTVKRVNIFKRLHLLLTYHVSSLGVKILLRWLTSGYQHLLERSQMFEKRASLFRFPSNLFSQEFITQVLNVRIRLRSKFAIWSGIVQKRLKLVRLKETYLVIKGGNLGCVFIFKGGLGKGILRWQFQELHRYLPRGGSLRFASFNHK